MSKMKTIFSILLILFTLNQSIAQWVEIDLNTSETLNQIYFINNDSGYIVGNNGLLFRTTDGGDNWIQINTNVSHNLFNISFANETIGFINGLKTTDGGLTWTIQPASEKFGLIHALDENNLIAVLDEAFSFYGDIYKSSDGGESWEIIANPIAPSTGAYTDVCFINDDLGYLSAWYFGHLVKTIDGGDNWTEIIIDEVDGLSFSNDDFRSVYFFTEDLGLVAHQNGILKTSDGGNTWSEIKPEELSESFQPESIIALSTANYILVGGFPNVELEKIYETSDGGITWIESVNTQEALFDVNCTMTNCFAVGTNGKVYKKENIVSSVLDNIDHPALNIYPNPTKDILSIETNLSLMEISILNTNGKLIYTSFEYKDKIDISYLHPGIYFIKVISDNGVSTKKIIKK